jgi:hypothetical protein
MVWRSSSTCRGAARRRMLVATRTFQFERLPKELPRKHQEQSEWDQGERQQSNTVNEI